MLFCVTNSHETNDYRTELRGLSLPKLLFFCASNYALTTGKIHFIIEQPNISVSIHVGKGSVL